MHSQNWQFFDTEFTYKQALKQSETVDGTRYNLSQQHMPLKEIDVKTFFENWPQYADFPYMDELVSNKNGRQSDAINALCDYTLFIDRTIFIF